MITTFETTFGPFFKVRGLWATTVICGREVFTIYARKRKDLAAEVKKEGYKFKGPDSINLIVLWANYPKYPNYIAQTRSGIYFIGETADDSVIIYDDGSWACDFPERWPKYLKDAMTRLAKRVVKQRKQLK